MKEGSSEINRFKENNPVTHIYIICIQKSHFKPREALPGKPFDHSMQTLHQSTPPKNTRFGTRKLAITYEAAKHSEGLKRKAKAADDSDGHQNLKPDLSF